MIIKAYENQKIKKELEEIKQLDRTTRKIDSQKD